VTELRQVLTESFQPRPVTAEVRALRERLCEFLRTHEARVYDVSHSRAGEVRTLLGWDDETMAAFIDSPLACQSSPHAAMNSFAPMLAFPWLLGRAVELAQERHGVPAVHLRTQCTHQDFDDTFAKPAVWWHRAPDGEVVKSHLFVRRRMNHHPILSKPAPRLDPATLHPVDRDAVKLAELGTNYAYYAVIYRAFAERVAGFHVPHRTLELPIDVLNRFTVREEGLLPWVDKLDAAGLKLRVQRPDAPLGELDRDTARELAATLTPDESWLGPAVIAPNRMNFAQFYRFGLSLMVGARAMAAYVPEMNLEIGKFTAGLDGWTREPPTFLPFTRLPFAELLGVEQEAARCQAEWGVSTSLSLVATAAGARVAEALEPMLALDYAELFDRSLVR
jgi:hypothetical protein